jgi:cell division protein FtsL
MNTAARLLNQEVSAISWRINLSKLSAHQWFVAMLSSLIVISSFSFVYVTNQTRYYYQKLQYAQMRENALDVQWGQLLLEQSTWATQARIQRIAEQRLGMQAPKAKKVVIIGSGVS